MKLHCDGHVVLGAVTYVLLKMCRSVVYSSWISLDMITFANHHFLYQYIWRGHFQYILYTHTVYIY